MNHDIRDHRIDVPGGKVHTRVWKTISTQCPILLIHDSLGCISLWRGFPSKLSSALNRTVIAYDRLGFGQSDKRKNLPSLDFINEEADVYIPAILSKIQMENCIPFGHSVGGAMALALAARQPKLCKAVISESAQVFVETRTLEGIKQAKKSFESSEQMLKLKKWHGDKAQWVLQAWTDIWLCPEFASWTILSEIPHIQVPLLAIHGDKDEFGSEDFPNMISKITGGPSQKHILRDCGHIPHRERESDVISIVKTFIEEAGT